MATPSSDDRACRTKVGTVGPPLLSYPQTDRRFPHFQFRRDAKIQSVSEKLIYEFFPKMRVRIDEPGQ